MLNFMMSNLPPANTKNLTCIIVAGFISQRWVVVCCLAPTPICRLKDILTQWSCTNHCPSVIQTLGWPKLQGSNTNNSMISVGRSRNVGEQRMMEEKTHVFRGGRKKSRPKAGTWKWFGWFESQGIPLKIPRVHGWNTMSPRNPGCIKNWSYKEIISWGCSWCCRNLSNHCYFTGYR